MASIKKTEAPASALLDLNKISRGTTLKGELVSDGNFRIDGVFEGNITTEGRIVVGESGSIKGDVICSDAEVEGTIEGDVKVTDALSIKSTGKIIGVVKTKRLAMELGAILDVTSCKME
ncbi:MAG: polymer-forming cytoskeletal protein [Flavobacteriales bacterium]|nr:polymer-forming cytoskeletal protein [Flavobacteriales bacterium]